MNTARTTAWAMCGTHNPAARATTTNPLVVDLDATEVLSHSDKEHATPTWKKHFGFHPLAAIIDHGDGLTGEPLAVLLRPGNAGSNTAADHITVLDQAVAALPDHVDGHEWDARLLIRTDAAGGSQAFLNHLHSLGLAYSVGFPVTWQIGEIASTLGGAMKQGIIRPDGTVTHPEEGYVADITSRMRSWAGEPGPDPRLVDTLELVQTGPEKAETLCRKTLTPMNSKPTRSGSTRPPREPRIPRSRKTSGSPAAR